MGAYQTPGLSLTPPSPKSDQNEPQVLNNCERMITGCQSSVWPWAVGGEDLVLPDDVGASS